MIFNHILGMFSTDMGIDLGTANTLVCIPGKGIILNEPSVVAVKRGTNQVLLGGNAVGHRAKDMLGKTPASIEAIRPMKDGVIANFDITKDMLAYFIRRVHKRNWGVKPRIVIAVPTGITTVEKNAVIEAAQRAGARKVFLVNEPMAAAIGSGMPVQEAIGSMIVDIGGGTSEVAIISLGGLVNSHSSRTAGDEMDQAIVDHMKQTYNLLIGPLASEAIKIRIGSAYPLEQEMTMEVAGLDTIVGLPRKAIISSEEIRQALIGPVRDIIQGILHVLDKTPPQLATDLVSMGMTLAGGGSLLRGLDKVISKETGLPTRRAEDPLTCVARGTGIFLDQLDEFAAVLESADEGM